MANKDEVIRAIDQEIDRLMKNGTTGELSVRVNFLTGGIAKVSKEIHTSLLPPLPRPAGRRAFDEPGKNLD